MIDLSRNRAELVALIEPLRGTEPNADSGAGEWLSALETHFWGWQRPTEIEVPV